MSAARPPRWARALVERCVGGAQREFVLGDLEELYAQRAVHGTTRALAGYLALGLASGATDLTRWAASASKRLVRGLTAGILLDTRHAVKRIRAEPGFHAAAAGVLALGVGMITFSWGIEYGVYGRGLPVRNPQRMAAVTTVDAKGEVSSSFSVEDAEMLRGQGQALEKVGLWGTVRVDLADADHSPEQSYALRVTPELFHLLEIEPARGRAFTPADGRPGATAVVLLGHRLWTQRYDADPDVLGGTVRIDGVPTVVVGVLPDGPTFQGEELWLPVPTGGADRRARSWSVLARTAPGTPVEAADRALAGLGAHLDPSGGASSTLRLRIVHFTESFREAGSVNERHLTVIERTGWLLFLMALANVVNLFLVRTRRRTQELAVRRALGAGRLRVLRQVLLEVTATVLPGLAGGGLVAAALLHGYQARMDAYHTAPVSWQRWTFGTAHLSVVAASGLAALLVVSLVVGASTLHADTTPSLRRGRGVTTRFRLAQLLVAVEIAGGGALFLLAALMVRSAWNLRTNDWGFAAAPVMTGHVMLPAEDARSPAERLRLWAELQAGLQRLPGVTSATLGTQLPVVRYAGRWGAWRPVEVDGSAEPPPEGPPHHYVAAVTASYFETFGAPVVRGRGFTTADDGSSEAVALVNTAFAARYFPDGDAVGRRIRVWDGRDPGAWRTVVGVAPHLWMDADEDRDPEGVYVPLAQAAPPEVSLAIRVRGDPTAYAEPIRRVVARLLPGVPMTDVWTMPRLIHYQTRLYRREGPLFIWFGVAALLLAVGGLYVVISYLAAVRAAEFGIRAAMGASRTRLIVRAVLWGIPSLAAGNLAGVVVGLWLTRDFARFMFEVDPWSPGVAAAGFGVLVLVAVAASLVPAIRAGRVDLVRVLKAE